MPKKRGHPVEYTKEVLAGIEKAMNEYTDRTAVPILAEFAYENNIRRGTLYDHKELTDARKRMHEKKEFQLEKLALTGKVNSTFAIFSLKQMGWTDKRDIEISGNKDKPIKMVSIADIMEGDESTP